MGFTPTIVLLTGLHFHYAGLLFPTLIGLMHLESPTLPSKLACVLAITAIPLTALGITTSHLYHIFAFETLSGVAVAISGVLCAYLYFSNALRRELSLPTKIGWSIVGLSLLVSMTLAAAYALRSVFFIEFLTIPNMRAFHGSINALGVAGGGLLGWIFYVRSRSKLQ